MTAIASPILASPQSTVATIEPIEAVLSRLKATRPSRSASPIGSTITAVCSFGLWPLWIWPQRWQAAADEDRRDLSTLAQWWNRQAPGPAARQLDAAANSVGRGAAASAFLVTAAALVNAAMLAWLIFRGVTVDQLIDITYGHRQLVHLVHGQLRALNLQHFWMGVLIAAYGLHYLVVRSHASAMKRYLAALDSTATAAGMRWPRSRYGFRGFGLTWALCGVGLCGAGLWWGVPLVMAGARQRQYLRRVRPQLRRDLAAQVRAAMGSSPVRMRRCNTGRCRAILPPAAQFCPRCGAMA